MVGDGCTHAAKEATQHQHRQYEETIVDARVSDDPKPADGSGNHEKDCKSRHDGRGDESLPLAGPIHRVLLESWLDYIVGDGGRVVYRL